MVRTRLPPREEAAGVGKHHFRRDIQGLRALAVLLVALCHAHIPGLQGGYVGVDVFFVISGFLITGWIMRRRQRVGRVPIREFYAARARRILPAAALTVVVTVIASYVLLTPVQTTSVVHDSVWAALFAANVHFASIGTNYFSSSAPPSPLQHYWSLAVEEQFYLVWPALAALALYGWGRGGKTAPGQDPVGGAAQTQRRLLLVLGASVVASLIWSIAYTAHDPNSAYFSTLTRAWELGAGGLLAVAATHLEKIPRRARSALSWLGLAGIVTAALTFSTSTAFPGYDALLPVSSAALIIAGGLGGATAVGAGRLLSLRPSVFIGDVSYSFYLWHWPVLVIASQYQGHELPASVNFGLLVAAFALSVVTYRYFEKPIHYGQRISTPWAGLSLWPATISVVVVVGLCLTASIDSGLDLPVHSGGSSASYVEAVDAAATPQALAATVARSAFAQIEAFSAGDEDRCVAQVGSETSSRICHLGDGHSPHVAVVFGDSHAQLWLDDLSDFGSRYNWQVVPLIKQGCVALEWSSQPNAPGPDDVVGTGRTPACAAWYKWALNEAKSLNPTVIIAATAYSWGASIGGSTLRDDVQGVQNEVNALHAITPRVVLLQDPPYWLDDPVSCLLAHAATVRSCSLTPGKSLLDLYSDIQGEAKRSGAKLMSVLQWFCTSKICPPVVNGNIVYRDAQHISPQYEAYLQEPFGNELKSVLGPA
jgi:peptidoglycan/LPS O-acetylase OafA/YrhL